MRSLGAEPVRYGPGLAERVRSLAPEGITAAADLFGTEAAYAALELGVAPERVSIIAARDPDLPARATGGADAAPGTLQRIAELAAQGRIVVPIAARYPVNHIRDAVTFQAGRHARARSSSRSEVSPGGRSRGGRPGLQPDAKQLTTSGLPDIR